MPRVQLDCFFPIGAVTWGHFYRGKFLFYHGKLYLLEWPTFSEVNSTVLNIHGYVKKIRRSAYDIKRCKLEGCFDARGTKANKDTALKL